MMSLLPDFTPRDPHSLWYTSSRHPPHLPPPIADSAAGPNGANPQDPNHRRVGHQQQQQQQYHHHLAVERSQLARLRADEQYMERRRINVQNFGSGWLKPVGVVKTLYQMREERREQEEHQEALRREALAQELAEAEAAGQEEFMDEEEGMDDVQLDEAPDLDDEIPEADGMSFGLGSDSDEGSSTEEGSEGGDDELRREQAQNELVTTGMRRTADAFREALARGHADPAEDMYGGEEALDEEGQSHMLDEEDFLQADSMMEAGEDLDMDANLDDEIPEAELSGYEHTDSDAELTSSEEDYSELRMARQTIALAPPQSPTLRAGGREEPRMSMDLSGILSHNESSFMESSPAMRGGRRP
ncbi:hypothetical protein jhhlp_005585 [Lomentospora prolificans]|uniref:Uncharacterized protein n=1 Tax=Lomentospora prolificans TaxID=41688 RepID=A0A2N3N3I5_9PEZI|nr:hypothetical protein jhhlp_005585 [Lomentospora prolificans]